MVSPWRTIKGAEPDAVKVASPVLNGGDEETYLQGNAPCPYPTPCGATPIPRRRPRRATARAAPSARCGSPPARPAARRSATFAGAGQAPQDGVG